MQDQRCGCDIQLESSPGLTVKVLVQGWTGWVVGMGGGERLGGAGGCCDKCVELAIRRWTRHHVHNAHHVSSTAEEKAPPGHYKEHTSRSILDIRGLASQRNQDAQYNRSQGGWPYVTAPEDGHQYLRSGKELG
jgi:hypothetical protein